LVSSETDSADFFSIDDDGDHQATHRELQLTQAKLGAFLDILPIGAMFHQSQGILSANEEAARILGVRQAELVGRHFLDFVAPSSEDTARIVFHRALDDGKISRSVEMELQPAQGDPVIAHVSMAPLHWEGLPVIDIVLHDITALRSEAEKLRRLATTDPLTGSDNRRCFLDKAAREVERARRYARPLSVLSLDIDYFKSINDTYGHQAGDEALRRFCQTIRDSLRDGDTLGRLGGEEFAIILPETDGPRAVAVGDRLRRKIEQIAVPTDDRHFQLTVSIGVADLLADESSIEPCLRRADQALYAAKHSGRNRVVRYFEHGPEATHLLTAKGGKTSR